MLTELCVFHDANAFKDIISATKDFVAKNETITLLPSLTDLLRP